MGLHPQIVLANRAYLDHATPPTDAVVALDHQPGGLLAAIHSLIEPWSEDGGTTWIGAGRGACDRAWTDERGYEMIPTARGLLRHRRLYFDSPAWANHYGAVANSFLWPLVHLVRDPLPLVTDYYPTPESPAEGQWDAFRGVNEAFAMAAMAEPEGPTCWVHDYQLALVPEYLARAGFRGGVGFFLHTPFPRAAAAEKVLDSRALELFQEWTRGLLRANLVGVQTERDRNHLLEAASSCGWTGPLPEVLVCPVGIAWEEVAAAVAAPCEPAALKQLDDPSLPLVVGLERADFTKGIPERMRSVARLLDEGERFNYLGVAAPTRGGVGAYARFDSYLRASAGLAEAAGKRAGVTVVQQQELLSWNDVVALQHRANVVVASSLADGMNLVPLQAAIAQEDRAPQERAVLVAGRDSGVAAAYAGFERDRLVEVDPLDPTDIDQVLRSALRGRPGRVSDRLIAEVKRRDSRAWARSFLSALERHRGC